MALDSSSSRPSLQQPSSRSDPQWRPAWQRGSAGVVARTPDADWLLVRHLVDLLAMTTQRAIELAKREAAQRALALTDELTGLNNRRGFWALAGKQLQIGERAKRPMVLFLIDVDRMKAINDTFGHAAGDEALVEVADGLRRAFRNSDVVARHGGDEFVALAVDASTTNALTIANRIQHHARASRFAMAHGPLSVSIGVARFEPGRRQTLWELMHQADQAMYARKMARQHRSHSTQSR